jgi:alpha-beta hydrolase superfamily lysophospholipase
MAEPGEGRFADGRLHYRKWPSDPVVRGQVVISHGYAEHSGRYDHVARSLNDRGLTVWAPDHRGHGQSEGDRGNVESVAAAVSDLDRFVDLVRQEGPEGPLYLVGHSMGGLIAAAYAEEHQQRLAGLALSGALLYAPPELAALADLEEIPDLGLADAVSRDPAVVQAYKDDPLVYLGPPPRDFLRSFATIDAVADRLAELTLPVLVMHGSADLLVSPLAFKRVVSAVSSDDLTAILWPGMWHEIFNEPGREDVLDVLAGWVVKRIPA